MRSREWVLVTCVLVIAAVVLLAPSLDDLSFEPARPVGRASDIARPIMLSELRIDDSTSVWEILLVWLAATIPLVLVVLLLPPELRKRVLQHLIRFALFVLALVLALRYHLIHLPAIDSPDLAAGQAGSQLPGGAATAEAFSAPALPAWITYLISLLMVAVAAGGGFALYRLWLRARVHRHSALDAIAAAARNSLDDLAEGRQWGDVVIEAYARMLDAVRVARGLQREAIVDATRVRRPPGPQGPARLRRRRTH